MYSQNDIQQILNPILRGDFRLRSERAHAILEALRCADEKERADFMAYVLRSFGTMEESDEAMSGHKIPDERYQELFKKVASDVSHAFHLWIRRNPTERELAKRLCDYLERISDEDERSVAFSVVLSDCHVPYCQIPDPPALDEIGCDEDELSGVVGSADELTTELVSQLVLAVNVLRRRNLSMGSTATLWKIIRDNESAREQFLLFSSILGLVESEAKKGGGILGAILRGGFR
ncbi:MAG: hypothetical protein Q7S84_02315 [bacterium]|nr:hypothetical protein [bacterium]